LGTRLDDFGVQPNPGVHWTMPMRDQSIIEFTLFGA
jgi:hypothetical protein